jgi:tetratricopeptide (TPR) repeat protein
VSAGDNATDALREEQRFLLESLRDLERERAAGDVGDDDYATLREGYVARAAAVTRRIEALEGGESATDPDSPADGENEAAPRRPWVRRFAVFAAVAVVAAGVGVFVARQSGQRIPGGTFTGGIEDSTATRLATARALNFSDPGKAIETYTEVLKVEPDNVEALTYRSWLLALTAREAEGEIKRLALATAVADLLRAQAIEPDYADARCFLAITYFRFLEQPQLAEPQLKACVASDPPAEVKSFVEAIENDLADALAGK